MADSPGLLNSIFITVYFLYALFMVVVVSYSVQGVWKFGYGLGDIETLGEHLLAFFAISWVSYSLRKKALGPPISMVLIVLAVTYIMLTLTAWRGPEAG